MNNYRVNGPNGKRKFSKLSDAKREAILQRANLPEDAEYLVSVEQREETEDIYSHIEYSVWVPIY